MARRYTDKEKATILHTLAANDGNASKTSRETGVPIQTIKDYKNRWDRDGVPPELYGDFENVSDAFIKKAETIRNKAMDLLDGKLPTASPKDLIITVGILSDKLNIAKGLATSRQEQVHTVTLPGREEVQELFKNLVTDALSAAKTRQEDIIDGEAVEIEEHPKGLPMTTEERDGR